LTKRPGLRMRRLAELQFQQGIDGGEDTMLAGPLALFVASLFTGAALYVSLAEQPARLQLDDAALLAEWQLSYARAAVLQATLSLIGFAVAIVAGQEDGWRWFLGGIVLFANWPYTFFCVAPLNRRISAFVPGTTTDVQLHLLVAQWGLRHAVRTALGGLASLIFVWALA
jgi:Domain of unknown function (DUF1772)